MIAAGTPSGEGVMLEDDEDKKEEIKEKNNG